MYSRQYNRNEAFIPDKYAGNAFEHPQTARETSDCRDKESDSDLKTVSASVDEKCRDSSSRCTFPQQTSHNGQRSYTWQPTCDSRQSCDDRPTRQPPCDDRPPCQPRCDDQPPCQPRCDDRPTRQPLCDDRPPCQPPCDDRPPCQPRCDDRPPCQPPCDDRPPCQPRCDDRPPCQPRCDSCGFPPSKCSEKDGGLFGRLGSLFGFGGDNNDFLILGILAFLLLSKGKDKQCDDGGDDLLMILGILLIIGF